MVSLGATREQGATMPIGRRADRRHWWRRVTPHGSEQDPATTVPDESEALEAVPFSSALDELFERQERLRATGHSVPQQRRRGA